MDVTLPDDTFRGRMSGRTTEDFTRLRGSPASKARCVDDDASCGAGNGVGDANSASRSSLGRPCRERQPLNTTSACLSLVAMRSRMVAAEADGRILSFSKKNLRTGAHASKRKEA